jgi:hypothetical protein
VGIRRREKHAPSRRKRRVFITAITREHDCGCVRRQEVGWVEPLVYHRMAVLSTVSVVSCVRFEVLAAVTVKDVGLVIW